MSWMSTYVSVEISPDTTTRPVFTSVSHATRPFGSSRMTASSTPSEIWSAILSGWPSVTDSDVNRYSLSANLVMKRDRLAARFPSRGRSVLAAALRPLVEVDDQRHAVHRVAPAQAVLDEEGVVAGHPRAGVDLDGEARGPHPGLRHVDQFQPVALL